MTWRDDGRVLVAGSIGLVALAGAIGKRRRGNRDTPAEHAAVKELVPWSEIHDFPANEVQRKAWEERGQVVCPHGSPEFRIYQILPVYWPSETEEGEPKKILTRGEWEWSGQIGPHWAECQCDPPARVSFRSPRDDPFRRWAVAWWLPEEVEIEWR